LTSSGRIVVVDVEDVLKRVEVKGGTLAGDSDLGKLDEEVCLLVGRFGVLAVRRGVDLKCETELRLRRLSLSPASLTSRKRMSEPFS
jgi:hypothetical protein